MSQQPAKIVHEDLRLDHDEDRGRYSLWQGATFIGFLEYTRHADTLTLQHTIISEAYSRRGYARALVTLVLDEVRAQGARIVPECSYVAGFLRRYPEYDDLLA
ncbi:GNAT family N-acetyltransferase [Zhihengliuella flava]|uniref:GNAT family acetyltransferase n=1 Tax=Zhihengliuella flava TaxID=1285193 RepID=A0A931DB52_9MICC|nr:GNAT family N-acetyltransferase [Zhihengliuella flava]MBG6085348.1 putative GNAT family acetyltransferase [Zhihengliuella flava]